MRKLTDKEIDLISHSLGVNAYNAKLSKKKKDKVLPIKFYRNYFCASVNHDDFITLNQLMLKGLMDSWTQYNNLYFAVTDKGISQLRSEWELYLNDQPGIKEQVNG